MKCGGMISPLASLTKPESIGCWISAWTSVVSPLKVARTRMVDAIRILLWNAGSAAAAADGHFDFLGRAVKLAAGFHDDDHIAGLRHLDAVGHGRHRAWGKFVGRHQCIRIFADQERNRGDIGKSRADRDRNHRAVLRDLRRVELPLVGSLRGLAIKQFDRIGPVLLFECLLRIFVISRGERRCQAKGKVSEADEHDRRCALQDQPPRRRKPVVSDCHLSLLRGALANHKVCRKSTTASISFSVKMRFRPNGGITVCGLRLVSSVTIATSSLRSGYLLLISFSAGPMVPGRSPPLISWQVRQLPLPRSKASFCPSAAADWALAGL